MAEQKKPEPSNVGYDIGYEQGFMNGKSAGRYDRAQETVWHGPPFKYWHWGEWATYVGFTVVAIIVALLIFWLVGCFIRWEVGPIPQVVQGSSNGLNFSTGGCTVESSTGTVVHCH